MRTDCSERSHPHRSKRPAHQSKLLRASIIGGIVASMCVGVIAPATAQEKKPNILFIMGDDIGWMQPSIYHRGLMVGETPNIDRIGQEGAMFIGLLRRAELHGRAQRLLHRHASAAHRHDPARNFPAALPIFGPVHRRSPSSCIDLGYTTGEFGKNHLGDHTESLPTAHGFQEYWGYLYHLDAMQGGELPRHQQDPDRAERLPRRARTRRFRAFPRSARRGGSQDHDCA